MIKFTILILVLIAAAGVGYEYFNFPDTSITLIPTAPPPIQTPALLPLTPVSSADIIVSLSNKYGNDTRQAVDVYYSNKFSKAPILVLIHGGGWYGGTNDSMGNRAKYFTEKGFVSVAPEYRVSVDGFTFPTQINDTACGIAWAINNASKFHADPTRIILYGSSAGAHIGSMLAYNEERNWPGNCGVTGISLKYLGFIGDSGPYDFDVVKSDRGEGRVEEFLGPSLFDPKKWSVAEPISFIDSNDAPALIMYGTEDATVNPQASINMNTALSSMGVSSILLSLEGGHIYPSTQIGKDTKVTGAVDDFIEKILGL